MKVEYVNKRWVTPQPAVILIRKLGYRLVGQLDNDNFIVQRRGERRHAPTRFHVLHISWDTSFLVEKYKLFRVTI
jgi:hypothetical protein